MVETARFRRPQSRRIILGMIPDSRVCSNKCWRSGDACRAELSAPVRTLSSLNAHCIAFSRYRCSARVRAARATRSCACASISRAIYSIPHRRAATLNVSSFAWRGNPASISAENASGESRVSVSFCGSGAFILLGQNARRRSICCALMGTIDVVARGKNYHRNDSGRARTREREREREGDALDAPLDFHS